MAVVLTKVGRAVAVVVVLIPLTLVKLVAQEVQVLALTGVVERLA